MTENADEIRLPLLEAYAENAYTEMYDVANPSGVAACYSEAKEAIYTAIGLARELGKDGVWVERAGVRDWVRPGISVFKNTFSSKVGKLPMYGLRDGEHVPVLCIHPIEKAGLLREQAGLLASHIIDHRAISIHWPSTFRVNSIEGLAAFFQQA
jgi:hypothetical protein